MPSFLKPSPSPAPRRRLSSHLSSSPYCSGLCIESSKRPRAPWSSLSSNMRDTRPDASLVGDEEVSPGTSFEDEMYWLVSEPYTGSSSLTSIPFDESGKGSEGLLRQLGSLTYHYLVMHTLSRRESSSLGLADCGSEDGLSSLPEALSSPQLMRQHVLPPATAPDPWVTLYGDNRFDVYGDSSSSGFMGSLPDQCYPSDALALEVMDDNLGSMSSAGCTPGLGPVDSSYPVTLSPGPANMFVGSPVQDF